MRLTEHGVAVQGSSTRATILREETLLSSLKEAAAMIGKAPESVAWDISGSTCVMLEDGTLVTIDAGAHRGFAASTNRGRGSIVLRCPIVEAFDHIEDAAARAIAHVAWVERVLLSPRLKGDNPEWIRAATTLAALGATLHADASVSCQLDPNESADPVRIDSTKQKGWRLPITEAVMEYVRRTCPPLVLVQHHSKSTYQLVTVERAPKVMCFAPTPDALETMRLMAASGLDPADLFRVGDDHG
jgi:hypothetical protein